MSGSIFPVLSFDREKIRWEDYLLVQTPVENHGGLRFKREDSFAPLGYGGINGGKVRQLVWLVGQYLAAPCLGPRGLIIAGSVKSPQLGRVPAVAKHFNLPVIVVMGTGLQTAMRHENVQIAAHLGAGFVSTRVAYNPALQKASLEVQKQNPGYYRLEYGLSVEGDDARVEQFYRFCSEQVRNLPPDVETLLVPSGSCNTTIAILYGLARFRPVGLKRVILFGIGPPRVAWFERRLLDLERISRLQIGSLFQRQYHHYADLAEQFGNRPAPYLLEHHDLHTTGFASYQDEMPAFWHGIQLHPTYEGKILTYMLQQGPCLERYLKDGKTMFWIVGSTPSWGAMARYAMPKVFG